MREFKWLEAVLDETCRMCAGEILRGTGFYFEVGARRCFCKTCGRRIRAVGYDEAYKERGMDRLFNVIFGDAPLF